MAYVLCSRDNGTNKLVYYTGEDTCHGGLYYGNVLEAKTPVIVWKKSINGLYEFRQLINAMRKIKEINDFLNNHTLYGEEITHNACYDLIITEKAAYVYLNDNNVTAIS